ncbi:MAG: Gfo/Idh/MocA family oxidoreductase [Gemmatimonadota bacterium]
MQHVFGLIGCGRMGDVWVEALGQHPDCRLAVTYDPDPAAAAQKAAAASARAADSLDALLRTAGLNAVVVATPTFTHPEVVSQCAAAGIHVLCEKPMALTLAGCRHMLEACRAAGVVLAIGHTIRFWGAFYTARQLVARGAIGTPCLAQVHRMGPAGLHRVPAPGDPPPTPPARWRFDTRYSGGDILEGLVHELDFARALLGQVRSACCESTGRQAYGDYLSPVVTQATLAFEEGGLATARLGGIVGFPCRGSWVAGTTGTLAWDAWEGPVRHHQPGADPAEVPGDATSAYARELLDFLAAVESGGEPENSAVNGLRNIGLGLALYRSMELGERVAFSGGLPDPRQVPEDYQYRGPSSIR